MLITILAFWLIVSWAVYTVASLLFNRTQKNKPALVAIVVAPLLIGSYAYIWNISWKGYGANIYRMVAFQIIVAALLILINYLQTIRRSYGSTVILIVAIPLLWHVISSQWLHLKMAYDTSLLDQRAMILTGEIVLLTLAYLRLLPPGIARRRDEPPPRKLLDKMSLRLSIVVAPALTISLVLPWVWSNPPTIKEMYQYHLKTKMHILQIISPQKKVDFLLKHLNYDAFVKSDHRKEDFYIPSPKRTWGALESRAVKELLIKNTGHSGIPYLKGYADELTGKRRAIMNSLINRVSSKISLNAFNYLFFICQGAPKKKLKWHAGKLNIPEKRAFTKSGAKRALNALSAEDYKHLLKETENYEGFLKSRNDFEGNRDKYLRLLQFIRQECRKRLDNSS